MTRVAKEVGIEGRLGGQANVEGVSGTWKDLTDNVNTLADNLTTQVRNIAEVTTAVATGDLCKKITVDVKGEILQLKNTINTMVDQLSSFADEVTRVAREVGTEGKLGGQAQGQGRQSGTWKDLTDNVNTLADNLTNQVRNIAEVTTAVAKGELSKKITVDARGEILELKNTINTMVDQLSTFAAEVTRVAKEVGTEGKLGVQAQVEGVSGVWKGLTDNVNQLAGDADDAAARDLRGLSGGDAGRPDALDRGRGGGRGRGAQGHDQPDDREPRRDDPRQHGAGLAELEHGALHRHAPGRARPRDGLAADHVRADTARRGAARRVLHDGLARRRGRRFRAPPGLHLRLQAAQERPEQVQGRRGSRRPGRARAEADPGHAGAGRLRPDQLGSRRRRRRST